MIKTNERITTAISCDEISIITNYLINKDTFNLSIINKNIYENRHQYSLYNIKFENINTINGYQIKGLICDELNKKVIKQILKLRVEQLNIIYHKDICLSELPNSISKLFIKSISKSQNKTKLPYGIKYFKTNEAEYSELDFSICNRLQHLELVIDNETEIILPDHEIETFIIKIYNICHLEEFKNKEQVTCVKWENENRHINYFNHYYHFDGYRRLNNLLVNYNYSLSTDEIDLSFGDFKLRNISISIELDVNPKTIILPNYLEKLILQLNNSEKLNNILIIKEIPETLRHIEIKTSDYIKVFIEKYADIDKLDVLKFTGQQVKFKVKSIKKLFLENCEVDLRCYKYIDNLQIIDSHIISTNNKTKIKNFT